MYKRHRNTKESCMQHVYINSNALENSHAFVWLLSSVEFFIMTRNGFVFIVDLMCKVNFCVGFVGILRLCLRNLNEQFELKFSTCFCPGSNEWCFKEVLRPGKRLAVNQTGSSNTLMFEVHYRDSQTRTTMTFIFNNSRITLLLDAMLNIYNFIMNIWDKPSQGRNEEML